MPKHDPATVERAVAMLGGRFWSSSESSGSDAVKMQPTRPSPQRSSKRQSGLGPILVVDDDRAIREIIAETLEFEGYVVEQASNGAEALRMIEEHQPSLVLLDMRMPILDGWGVARTLQARGVRVPIVVLTAAKNARSWASEIGASAFLDKPFEDTDLIDTVERFRQKLPRQ